MSEILAGVYVCTPCLSCKITVEMCIDTSTTLSFTLENKNVTCHTLNYKTNYTKCNQEAQYENENIVADAISRAHTAFHRHCGRQAPNPSSNNFHPWLLHSAGMGAKKRCILY